MRNSTLNSSAPTSITVKDSTNNNKLTIGRRGVLLSVLGIDLVGTEMSAELDGVMKKRLTGKVAFYEFSLAEAEKSQLCVSYNETSNTVYIIGITDVIVGFAAPVELNNNNVSAFGVKLKRSQDSSLQSKHIILARLEGKIGSTQKIAFYLIEEANI